MSVFKYLLRGLYFVRSLSVVEVQVARNAAHDGRFDIELAVRQRLRRGFRVFLDGPKNWCKKIVIRTCLPLLIFTKIYKAIKRFQLLLEKRQLVTDTVRVRILQGH